MTQFHNFSGPRTGSRHLRERLASIIVFASGIGLIGGAVTANAQPGAKTTPKKVAPAAKAAPEGKATTNAKQPATTAEPATVEQAAKVLDLRTFPVMEGADVGSMRTLGMLMYEVKSPAKGAFEFQKAELVKRGFKELAGGYSDAMTSSAKFAKDGFQVAVSTSASSGDPKKVGFSYVSLVNDGNVALEKLPVPPGVKPFFPQAYRAAYTTDAKVADAAAACRKLLLAAGWEPYGGVIPTPDTPDTSTQYFKRNAIKLQSSVMITPAEGGKTLIQYSAELLQADLPVPPDIADPRYTDFQKTLHFDEPKDKTEAIVAFYQQRLPKQGWKATTDKPIVDDRDKSQFVIYRNAQKDLLSLDLKQFTDIVRVTLKHQTEAEVAEEERLAKAEIEKKKAEDAKRDMKVKVEVPLPAKAGKIDKLKENVFEFTVATGTCLAALEGFRKHFLKEGWTEDEGTQLEENAGNMDFKKGEARLSFSYIDAGFGDAEIKVSGSPNVVLETAKSKDKTAADEPKTKKKKAASGVPGLPDLPPGVEIPDDVKALLKKAQKDAEKKPAPKKDE